MRSSETEIKKQTVIASMLHPARFFGLAFVNELRARK